MTSNKLYINFFGVLALTAASTLSAQDLSSWRLNFSLPEYDLQRAPNRTDNLSAVERQMGITFPDSIVYLDGIPKDHRSSRHPWLHRSWKLSEGMIGNRYLDPSFSRIRNFPERQRYIQYNPMDEIARSRSRSANALRDLLSPAEKYDLLVGDLNSTLTRSQWRIADNQYRNGGIGDWMGLCDGSAAATFITKEPVRNVVMKDPIYGRDIRFFASDIKALASLLYSEFVVAVPVVGGRCNRDSLGTIAPGTVPECESLNPATWHRAVLHLAGELDEGLFIDHTPTREVWNTPVFAYSYSYYNPSNRQASRDLNSAMIPLHDFRRDAYRHARNPETASIVGVKMDIYTAGGSTRALDGALPAQTIKKSYHYDLEIDALGRVVGGEWYSVSRPDFFWVLKKDFEPNTHADRQLGVNTWGSQTVPRAWLPAIREGSAKAHPMGAIVRRLIDLSAGRR
jgi:hypothetical protein